MRKSGNFQYHGLYKFRDHQGSEPLREQQKSDDLEYSRRLFEKNIDWYKNADAKAQVLLTLDGAFLTFLTGSIFQKPEDTTTIVQRFQPDTSIFLKSLQTIKKG